MKPMKDNLKDLLKGICSEYQITKGGIPSFEHSFINNDPQAKKYFAEVHKWKGRWMNGLDIYLQFQEILDQETWELPYGEITTPQKLKTCVSEQFIGGLCDKIINSLETIPTDYSILFELPSAIKPDKKELNLADGISLFAAKADNEFPPQLKLGPKIYPDWCRRIESLISENWPLVTDIILHGSLAASNLPKNSQKLLSDILDVLYLQNLDVESLFNKLKEGRLYLRIDVKGYIGKYSSKDSKTVLNALSRFKQIIMLGILSGIFTTQNTTNKLESTSPAIYIYRVSKNEKRAIRTLQLRYSDYSFLSRVNFCITFRNGEKASGEELLLSQFQQFVTSLNKERPTEDIRRIRTAIEWAYDSLSNNNRTIGFLEACIGIEALFGDEDSHQNITKILAERGAYTLGHTFETRKRFKLDFKKCYDVRSKIVHGREAVLSQEQANYLSYIQEVLKQLILEELSIAVRSNS